MKVSKKTQCHRSQGRRAILRAGGQRYRMLRGDTQGNPRDSTLTRQGEDGAVVIVAPETAASLDRMKIKPVEGGREGTECDLLFKMSCLVITGMRAVSIHSVNYF